MGAISIAVENATGGLFSNFIVEDNAFLTNTLLGASGVYTSGAISLQGRRLVGSVWSTKAGAANTFAVQGSDDGINWEPIPAAAWTTGTAYITPTTTVAASTFYVFDVLLFTGLTRVVYTNGGSAMVGGTDTFRLAGYLSPV